MNLVPCEDCGNEISKHAFSCPKCGRFMKTGQKMYIPIYLFLFVIAGFQLVNGCLK